MFFYIEPPEVHCTTQPPLTKDGIFEIPSNGYGVYICERETNSSFHRHNWHLISSPHTTIDQHSIIIASTRPDPEPCVLTSNKTCDAMAAIIVPSVYPFEINNIQIKGCTLLREGNNSYPTTKCVSEWTPVRIIEGM